MTELFDRRIRVTVDTIEFTGLDAAFRIEKTLKPQPNTCELTIWNLNEEHQGQLEQLRPKEKQAIKGIPCRIEAGYVSGTSLLWLGDLRTVQTTREGPDWVTVLTSGDGEKAWKNARMHIGYGPKTSLDTALRAIVRALGVGAGNLSKVVSKLKIAGASHYPSGAVLSGSASRQLADFARSADLEVSVQDGALQFLDKGKALSTTAVRLAPETGLIGSPTVNNEGVLSAQCLIIPDIRVGGLITIDAARVKGTYRIEKATWNGDMSGQDWSIDLEAKRY